MKSSYQQKIFKTVVGLINCSHSTLPEETLLKEEFDTVEKIRPLSFIWMQRMIDW